MIKAQILINEILLPKIIIKLNISQAFLHQVKQQLLIIFQTLLSIVKRFLYLFIDYSKTFVYRSLLRLII